MIEHHIEQPSTGCMIGVFRTPLVLSFSAHWIAIEKLGLQIYLFTVLNEARDMNSCTDFGIARTVTQIFLGVTMT